MHLLDGTVGNLTNTNYHCYIYGNVAKGLYIEVEKAGYSITRPHDNEYTLCGLTNNSYRLQVTDYTQALCCVLNMH